MLQLSISLWIVNFSWQTGFRCKGVCIACKVTIWQFPFLRGSDISTSGNFIKLSNDQLIKWSFRFLPLRTLQLEYPGKISHVPGLVLEVYLSLVKYEGKLYIYTNLYLSFLWSEDYFISTIRVYRFDVALLLAMTLQYFSRSDLSA